LIGNVFGRFDPGTLTFDPVTPKSIGFICYPGPNLKKVGQGVLELLIRLNEKVTDRPTDMCKAICPLFFVGGHKKDQNITAIQY